MEHKTEAKTDGLSGLNAAQSGTLEALAMALDYRDQSTSGHSRRVANLVRMESKGLRCSPSNKVRSCTTSGS